MNSYTEAALQAARSAPRLFDLSGRTAVVIGGTKGLGQAMALAIAGAGAKVCVASRGPQGFDETREALHSLTDNLFEVASLDATDEERVGQFFTDVKARFGSVDILVNSQGIVRLGPSETFSLDDWQDVMDVNLKSVFLCCKHGVAPMLENGWGRIINVSSVRGFQGRSEDSAYAPSKGAVNQLTRSLAIEWGARGVTVNALAPVFTKTAISEDFLKDEHKKQWVLGRIPLGRLGQLSDVMGPVIFLASEASCFVNGHVLLVDGGWVAA